MMKGRSKKKAVDPKLVQAIKDMMEEVMAKPEKDEKPKYSLADRCRVIDRFIKIESIRLDVQEDSGGEFFKRKEADDEPNE